MPACCRWLRSWAQFGVGEELVGLLGDVPFEAADDLWAGFAFGLAFSCVCGDGVGVVSHAGGSDPAVARCWLGGCLPG